MPAFVHGDPRMPDVPLEAEGLVPAAEPLPEPQVGDMLGAYRLDALAGEGGMGRVFCAVHTKLGKRVAIKILRRRYSRREESIARFFQEARAVNLIHHPNIVEITDLVDGAAGGDSYYIMEWLSGTTLAARLHSERALPADLVIQIGRQVASALAAVHKVGLVHRDLKPENIFLVGVDGSTDAKILDFGVAMETGPTDGAVAGTPAYFSPEGAAGRALDGRSDIYSLGVMLYELLAGATPFQASSLSEYVMKHMTARPRPLNEVVAHSLPPGLAEVINRCLEKSPDARFRTMEELGAALAAIGPTDEPVEHEERLPWARIGLASVAVLLASFAITRGLRHRPISGRHEVESRAAPAMVAPAAPAAAVAPPSATALPAPAPPGTVPAAPAPAIVAAGRPPRVAAPASGATTQAATRPAAAPASTRPAAAPAVAPARSRPVPVKSTPARGRGAGSRRTINPFD